MSSAFCDAHGQVVLDAAERCPQCERNQIEALLREPPNKVSEAIARETPIVSDHALAAAELLQQVVDRLMAGQSPEDLGADVQRFGRMMERRI